MRQQCTSPPQPGSDPRPSLRGRVLAVMVRPAAPPVWLGTVVAVAFIAAETLLVYQLRQIAPENAFGALFLLGVLVISAGGASGSRSPPRWRAPWCTSTSIWRRTARLSPHPQDWVAILIFLPVALLANHLAGQARLRTAESELRRREAEAAHAAASALAEQQAALRRVATMVARGVDPSEVYPAAVAELSRGLGIGNVALLQYEKDRALCCWQTATTGVDETVYRRAAFDRRRQCGGDDPRHKSAGTDD